VAGFCGICNGRGSFLGWKGWTIGGWWELSRAWANKGNGLEEVLQFRPMNLRWSFLDWRNPVIHAVGISPDMGRHCDLAAITDPNHPDLRSLPEEPEKTRLCLQTEFLGPTTGRWLPGKYRFRLLVAASNRKPVAYFVEIHLTGLWSEDQAEMFKNGFTVNVRRESWLDSSDITPCFEMFILVRTHVALEADSAPNRD
jgi:hypothetical protein